MNTGGFDLVVEINERFINRSLALGFYASLYPEIEGDFVPDDIPTDLMEYAKMHVKVRLMDPPVVRSVAGFEDKVEVICHTRVELKLLSEVTVKVDANVAVSAVVKYDPVYNNEYGAIFIDIQNANFYGVVLNSEYSFSENVLIKINEAICAVFKTNLLDDKNKFIIQPKVPNLEIPKMVPGTVLAVIPKGLKMLNPKVYAIALNLLEDNYADLGDVNDFTSGNDFAAGVSDLCIHKLFDFLWDKTTIKKVFGRSKTEELPGWRDFFDAAAFLNAVATEIVSLGFVESDLDVTRVWIDYGATVDFGTKPIFDLKDGNVVEILSWIVKVSCYAKASATVHTAIKFDNSGLIPDDWTPWEDDITVYEGETTVQPIDWHQDLSISLKNFKARTELDDKFMLKLAILDFDIDVKLDSGSLDIVGPVINMLIDLIIKLIRDKIPEFTLAPTLTATVTSEGLTIKGELRKLLTSEDEAVVAATASFVVDGRHVVPVPRFIGNKGHMEVHRSTCVNVDEIKEKHKVAYFSVSDALEAGFDGCKDCLPEYHTR